MTNGVFSIGKGDAMNGRGKGRKRRNRYGREFFVERGREGGRIGGKVRAKKMTADERSASARHAVLVRWRRWREQHTTITRNKTA